MLTIYVLNVGHGDSIVLRYESDDGISFAVIDSNADDVADPPALRKLRSLDAQRLSFVALTHPHSDHYRGLPAIFDAYRGLISAFYSFPLQAEKPERLKKLCEIYKKVHDGTDSPTIRTSVTEYVRLVHSVRKQLPRDWFECTGPRSEIFPVGFRHVEMHAILPPAKVKGAYFQQLEMGCYDVGTDREKENDLSLAFSLTYAGHTVILGGDGSRSNWLDHRRHFQRKGRELAASVVKLPHHGSRQDSSRAVLDHLFASSGQRIACISANGRSHPHSEIYKDIERRGVLPYCTNLATECGATTRKLATIGELEPALRRFVNVAVEPDMENFIQPCQGDIEVTISASGNITVTPQYAHPCPYRGDLDFLAPLVATFPT